MDPSTSSAPGTSTAGGAQGVPPHALSDEDLVRELDQLHRTRADTLRHGSDSALATHEVRTEALEAEYVRRWPDRDVDPARTRAGRRAEHGAPAGTDTSPASEESP
jgi:hypothetical protein